jgi:hypothetical protein
VFVCRSRCWGGFLVQGLILLGVEARPTTFRATFNRPLLRVLQCGFEIGPLVEAAAPLLEAEGYKYTIRLPANSIWQESIAWLLKRPIGRPPHEVRRYYASFSYRAGSWTMPRRVVAKVEWHPEELYPRVGFIVTNMARPVERVVPFYNQRGTAEQWIKEGKNAIAWTHLASRSARPLSDFPDG